MPFYVYQKVQEEDSTYFKRTGNHFSFAGHNLIYELWKKLGKPINQGWHITSVDLVEQWSGQKESYEHTRLIIDYNPSAKWRIGLAEALDIYMFTYGDEKTGEIWWSPMMWRLKSVFEKRFEPEIDEHQKMKIIERIETFDYNQDDIIQFLYIHGDKRGWNWGATGRTNGAMIEKDAREYFKRFF